MYATFFKYYIPRAAANHYFKCGHIFCQECINSYMHKVVASAVSEADSGFFACPSCSRFFTEIMPVDSTSLLDDDMPPPARGGESQSSQRSRNGRIDGHGGDSKSRDAMGFEPKFKNSTWVSQSDYDEKLPLVPSAKTTMLKGILLTSFKEAPMDKVFTPMPKTASLRAVSKSTC